MDRKKVLFVCIHNSARSQMAEAFVNTLSGGKIEAFSAGLEPGTLNPVVVEVMKEVGIDISGATTKSVFDFYKSGTLFSHVFTVCDEASGQLCPIFPGLTKNIHWSFPDPSALTGTREEILQKTREIRDMVRAKVEEFLRSVD